MLLAGLATAIASPAGAQSLGVNYQAWTTVWRTGIDAGISESGNQHYDSTVPRYSGQESSIGSVTHASANAINGLTVSADATIVYDTHFDDNDASNNPKTWITATSGIARENAMFSIEGPSSDTWIPVLLSASGYATEGGSAYFSFTDPYGDYYDDYYNGVDDFAVSTAGPSGQQAAGSFEVNQWIYLKTGRVYELFLSAGAGASWDDVSSHNVVDQASAWVDPILTVQGDFAGDYHLVGLPASAIGGVAAVPEPANWAMMVGGFGLIGSTMRRRRASVRFAS